ncbi:29K protein [Beet soil-borne mosaic virus]|uniref:29K protein n=1 Tax=Beet soil-borne mosaic virus TaxID=76343 RepID=Q9IF43_9VIRU|nr:29K protein [Beet soil-borne mosaic virus]APZ76020.1 29K protein [Beet soil-borne mosaic virus]WIW79804.1 p29 protein [Beet soil-borne mosaic virus]
MDLNTMMPAFNVAYWDGVHAPYVVKRMMHEVVMNVGPAGFICYPLPVDFDLNDTGVIHNFAYHNRVKTMRLFVGIQNNCSEWVYGRARFVVFSTSAISPWVNNGCMSLFSPFVGVNSPIDRNLLRRDSRGVSVLWDRVYRVNRGTQLFVDETFNFIGPGNYPAQVGENYPSATTYDSIYVACVTDWIDNNVFRLTSDSVGWFHSGLDDGPRLAFGQGLNAPDDDGDGVVGDDDVDVDGENIDEDADVMDDANTDDGD